MKKDLAFRLMSVSSLLCIGALVSGCSFTTRPRTEVTEVQIDGNYSPHNDGVVEYVWEEPMADVIEVPPGLDPEGIYYRPAHHEVVEIRQGRWRYYRQNQSRD